MTGAVTSWFFVGASAGSMVFPWLMGQFFESVSPLAVIYIIMGDLFIALVVYAILMRVSQPAAYPQA
jgi:hypothetical protein